MRARILLVTGLLFVVTAVVLTAGAATGKVTFTKDVAPIFDSKCADCHRAGGGAPMALETYTDARPWAKSIREKVATKQMPPWHADSHYGIFTNDRSLSPKQVETVLAWVDQGAPKGDDGDLPKPRQFPKGEWTIGTPDLVISMPLEYDVPADGVVPYKHFPVPSPFKEDVWVQAAEAVPGNRAVVHHIVVFVVPPGEKFRQGPDFDNNILVGQAPGEIPSRYPAGTAKRIKAGSTFVMQMHYTPNGTAAKDRSSVGLIFSKEPVRKTVQTKGVANWRFQIPPGEANFLVESQFLFKEAGKIVSFMPHMHVRGKDFLYRAVYPDGRTEVLLSVPSYDFNWQTYYHLKEPKAMPAGTRLECVAHYDNSTANKLNPDPAKMVRPGEQTWEEMMIGWIDYVLENEVMQTTSAGQN